MTSWDDFASNWRARGDPFTHMVNAGAINTIWLDHANQLAEITRPAPGCSHLANTQTGCGLPRSTIVGTSVTIDGRGNADDVGIMRVQIIVDGSVKSSSNIEEDSESWTWNFAATDFGTTHDIMACAFDYAGRNADAANNDVTLASS